ncbi:DUF1998 domain-containing protein [Domibacillus enclensis]|uniref:MrfA-like Zn-binding domain-containing protein n=1 Tax=Domibacillus enclensis TaxID=1017273 RepID=A0A1N7C4L6_9BACI|nr:DUF1998 domain-containing protein [Domibacillus enclensis]OXS74233.1 hypothetical protein B1B05_17320 [Domibacillus enclensis]SIR58393.1 protein of unknown function [Domibacillus enclensis]
MSKKIGEIRPSQYISTFGPGAVIELPDFSVIMAGLDEWETRYCKNITDPRLVRKLGLEKILSLPSSGENTGFYNQIPTVPSFRFPLFHVCPNCRKLAPYSQFSVEKDGIYCFNNKLKGKEPCDKVKAFPVRFVSACENGHLNEFPWNFYVHKSHPDCKGELYLEDTAQSGAVSDIKVSCKKCGASRSLNDAFQNRSDEKSAIGKCFGSRPWLGKNSGESCDQTPRVIMRGASNLYFSVIESALAIPPYSNLVHEVVARSMKRLSKTDSFEKLQSAVEDGYLDEFEEFDLQEVWFAIQQQNKIVTGESQDLLRPEWNAIINGSAGNEEKDFQTDRQDVPDLFQSRLSHLIMVKRLKEVRALKSFTRISPLPDTTSLLSGDADESETISQEAPLSKKKLDWRPGVETHGEGIFIALNEEELTKWEHEKAVQYGRGIVHNYEKYCDDRNIEEERRAPFPGMRYMLLHTLSHALIRELCLSSGYSSSSLRERLYSRESDDPTQRMAGILIYTATPDSEGSLGGLVELGKTEKFNEILQKALDQARLCSNDPFCSEHTPGTMGNLSGAACHSCMMASETSCERANHFLDRSLLVKTLSNPNLNYFE